MTIGIDCRLYKSGVGVGRYTHELVRNLEQIVEDSEHSRGAHSNDYVLFMEPEGYESYTGRFQKVLVDCPKHSLAEQTKYLKILNAHPVDLMHFTQFNKPLFYRKPYIVTIHDLILHYYPTRSYNPKPSLKQSLKVKAYKTLMASSVKNAKKVISVSQHTKDDIIREINVDPDKIQVIPLGVPIEFLNPAQGKIQDTPNADIGSSPPFKGGLGGVAFVNHQIKKPYLLYTGVWRSHKNLLNLLKAFAKLKKKIPEGGDPHPRLSNLKLVLTGKVDSAYPEIPQLITELGLHGSVKTPGRVSESELQSLYQSAHGFVFPSLYEGFGLPPLEAQAFGVPVASSNRSSLPEVLGDSAIYFNPLNVDEMSDQILKLCTDDQLRSELMAKGKTNLHRFSWKNMAKEILNIYQNLT